jgi:hypothetical protein
MGYDKDEVIHVMERIFKKDSDITVDELVEETFSEVTNDLDLGEIPDYFYDMAEEWLDSNRSYD